MQAAVMRTIDKSFRKKERLRLLEIESGLF